MSQQVRFAPGSLDCVYVKAGHVTVQRTDGSERVLAPGHHPDWLDSASVAFCPPEDGFVQVAALDGLGHFDMPAGNTLTASAGKVAVHRTDPRRTICSWGKTLTGETDPVLSADGEWMATLGPDWPSEGLATLRVSDTSPAAVYRDVYVGAPLRPRFSHSGTSLAWEEAGGQIFGIADVANPQSPVVRLSRPEDSLSHPIPIWCPERGELLVCYVQSVSDTEGQLVVAEWGSCVAQNPTGYIVTRSGGSGFDMDAKEAA
jgi:hypothetical protein